MTRNIVPLFLAVCGLLAPAAGWSQSLPADSTIPGDAYLDDAARTLVAEARQRLLAIDRSIEAYSTDVTERITVSVRTPLRDRVLLGREVAAEVDWVRDGPVTINVLGAKQVLPSVTGEEEEPDDVGRSVRELAFEPSEPILLGDWGSDPDLIDPLRPQAERHYRYRSGASQTIRLPGGEEVRLLELQILPRRAAPNLVRGTYLLDERTYSIVQGTFRLAGDWQLEDEVEAIARWVGPVRARIDHFTVSYGLWELNWWMPQVIAVHGEAEIGGFASVPLRFERRYGGYRIQASPVEVERVTVEQLDSITDRPGCPAQYQVVVRIGDDGDEPGDGDVPEDPDEDLSPEERRECERLRIHVPEDSVLLASTSLSDIPFGSDETLLSDEEMRRIRERVGQIAGLGPAISPVKFSGPRQDLGLVRYNRVEGLSLGIRAESETRLGRITATGRVGSADRQPLGELRLLPDPVLLPLEVGFYRRLAAMDSTTRLSSLGNTFSALVLGRDEADYFRELGVEVGSGSVHLTGSPLRWRAWAQRETAAEKRTDFSLAETFGGENRFPENAAAADATRYGAALGLVDQWGGGGRWRLGLEGWLEGATGTYRYLQPSAVVRAMAPLPGSLTMALEGAAGTTRGDAAIQHLYWLGGSRSLRGYRSGYLSGESFWRGRAEIGTEFPAFRASLFGDAGWAGPEDEFGDTVPALSVGVGVGLLDGLMRLDLARALRGDEGWRLTGSLDAWF